ncbi:replicative DNA helicase [Acinetobacter baumannii]|nr:replicative DNA helicase [Acinetobacter baumannii]
MTNDLNVTGIEKDPLSDPSIESSVLVSILTISEAADYVAQMHEHLFTIHTHQVIFKAMRSLYERGEIIDELTVLRAIKSLGAESRGINEQYIIELLGNVVGKAINFKSYIKMLEELHLRRQLRDVGKKTQIYANDVGYGSADDVLEKANTLLSNINSVSNKGDVEHLSHSVISIMEEINSIQTERMSGQYRVRGVNTGFVALDHRIGEINNGDLVVIAARPSMGKTAFALNLATNIATNLRKPVLIESIEMKRDAITKRIISSVGDLKLSKIKNAELDGEDWTCFTEAAKVIQNSPLMIMDGAVTISDIRKHARKVRSEEGSLGAIFVDYLQKIITPHLPASASENDRLTYISDSLKRVAMEFNCPVFALSQLSRQLENRSDKRPIMSDLRGSGAIEQDADVILFLYRDEYYNGEKSKTPGLLEVNAAKVRDGSVGKTFLCSELDYSRFSNVHSDQLAALESKDNSGSFI